jgi:hypothetical protein
MVQQLNEKTRVLIEATSSPSHLGMQLEQRIETLHNLKSTAEGLINETIQVLTAEGYEKNREMIAFCFKNLTTIGEQLDSAIRTLRTKQTR